MTDKEQPDQPFDHPPRLFYPRTPRRELDFDVSDLRRIIDYGEPITAPRWWKRLVEKFRR